jgi:peptidylprolyl isomerase
MKSSCKVFRSVLLALIIFVGMRVCSTGPNKSKYPVAADVLAASKATDWRTLYPGNTLYLELASGRGVIELAPAFAARHLAVAVEERENALNMARQIEDEHKQSAN